MARPSGSCFNEAGAIKPRKPTMSRFGAGWNDKRFNEAGAIKPRKPVSAVSSWRFVRRLQ